MPQEREEDAIRDVGPIREALPIEISRQFAQPPGKGLDAPLAVEEGQSAGSSAGLVGRRESTVDIDLKLDPEPPGVFAGIARAKDGLDVNIELAAPDDFIPALPGWHERSRFIIRHGPVDYYHYDFHAQALAKIERGHETDLLDVGEMARRGLIRPRRLAELFDAIRPALERYPAVDPPTSREKVRWAIEEIGP